MGRGRAEEDPPGARAATASVRVVAADARFVGRTKKLVLRTKEIVVRSLDLVPGARRLLSELARVEIIDRALVIAAQTLFSVTPLLIVLAAFTPHKLGESITEHLAGVMGVGSSATQDLENVATSEQVRTQTGVGGIVIVVFSAMSFARALQRMFERVWELPHRGGVVGNKRCLFWLVGWVAYLQVIAVLSSVLSGGDLSVVRLTVQFLISVGLWWWTARMLLMHRLGWASLLLGAVLTGVGMVLLSHFSRLFMPAYVSANVDQFGGLGLLFAASTWLLALGAVIVAASIIGRVYTEEIGPLRRFAADFDRSHATTQTDPVAGGDD